MLGQVVYNNEITTTNGNINEQVKLGKNIPNGMYLATLHSGSGNMVFHFVLEQ